jgi:hypothetical protein
VLTPANREPQKDELLCTIGKEKLDANEVKPRRETIVCRARQDLGQKISNHVLRDAEYQPHVALHHHATHKMVPDRDVANLAHAFVIHGNCHCSLGISVDGIGFPAKKPKEAKHILNMSKLLAAHTRSDELSCTCGISDDRLACRASHDGSPVDEDDVAGVTVLVVVNGERSVCVRDCSEAIRYRQDGIVIIDGIDVEIIYQKVLASAK